MGVFAFVVLVRLVVAAGGLMKKNLRIRLAVATVALSFLAGCGEEKNNAAPAEGNATTKNTAATSSSPPANAANTTNAELANQHSGGASMADEHFVTVSGPLIVEHQVEVTAQRDGVVAKIMVQAGTRVKTGAVLARLDDRQVIANWEAARAKTRSVEADVKNWQAEAEVMQADYVRAQRLWDLSLISEEQLQHAKFKVESEQWDIRKIRELLTTSQQEEHSLLLEKEKTVITSPFPGLVARRYVREGQSVSKGEKLFWVTAEAPLLLRFTLPEKFVGHLKTGQMLTLTSPDLPREKHNARIKEVSPVIDPASGTVEVLAEVLGERGELRPGMTANIRVETPR